MCVPIFMKISFKSSHAIAMIFSAIMLHLSTTRGIATSSETPHHLTTLYHYSLPNRGRHAYEKQQNMTAYNHIVIVVLML